MYPPVVFSLFWLFPVTWSPCSPAHMQIIPLLSNTCPLFPHLAPEYNTIQWNRQHSVSNNRATVYLHSNPSTSARSSVLCCMSAIPACICNLEPASSLLPISFCEILWNCLFLLPVFWPAASLWPASCPKASVCFEPSALQTFQQRLKLPLWGKNQGKAVSDNLQSKLQSCPLYGVISQVWSSVKV